MGTHAKLAIAPDNVPASASRKPYPRPNANPLSVIVVVYPNNGGNEVTLMRRKSWERVVARCQSARRRPRRTYVLKRLAHQQESASAIAKLGCPFRQSWWRTMSVRGQQTERLSPVRSLTLEDPGWRQDHKGGNDDELKNGPAPQDGARGH